LLCAQSSFGESRIVVADGVLLRLRPAAMPDARPQCWYPALQKTPHGICAIQS
jgi:hypothetical protein